MSASIAPKSSPSRHTPAAAEVSALKPPALFSQGEPARRALLLAGAVIFGDKGLDGATTREIAAQANQNIAAIAYYFQSKQGLYLEIAREIGREIGQRIGLAVNVVNTLGRRPGAAESLQLLKRLLTMMAHLMMTAELPAVSQFIVREQQKPGPAFDLIYEGGMRGAAEALTRLVAAVFDLPRESLAAKLRAHALMGQVLGFRVAHATLLRRTGWQGVSPREAQQVAAAVAEIVDLMAAGHRVRQPAPRRQKNSSKASSQAPSKTPSAAASRSSRPRKARRPESSS